MHYCANHTWHVGLATNGAHPHNLHTLQVADIVEGAADGLEMLGGGRFCAIHAILPRFTCSMGKMRSEVLIEYNTFVSDSLPQEVLEEVGKPGTHGNIHISADPTMRAAIASAVQRQKVTGVSRVTPFGPANPKTSVSTVAYDDKYMSRVSDIVNVLKGTWGDDTASLARELANIENMTVNSAELIINDLSARTIVDTNVEPNSPSL